MATNSRVLKDSWWTLFIFLLQHLPLPALIRQASISVRLSQWKIRTASGLMRLLESIWRWKALNTTFRCVFVCDYILWSTLSACLNKTRFSTTALCFEDQPYYHWYNVAFFLLINMLSQTHRTVFPVIKCPHMLVLLWLFSLLLFLLLLLHKISAYFQHAAHLDPLQIVLHNKSQRNAIMLQENTVKNWEICIEIITFYGTHTFSHKPY